MRLFFFQFHEQFTGMMDTKLIEYTSITSISRTLLLANEKGSLHPHSLRFFKSDSIRKSSQKYSIMLHSYGTEDG